MKKIEKSEKQKQEGITLIALVVTIVVLLILAATSIVMLTGDNGIITNAQKAQIANQEGEVIDKMGLAYSAVKTEAMIKMSTDPGYQPIMHIKELAEIAAKELGIENAENKEVPEIVTDGYHVYYQNDASIITMLYGDNMFALQAGDKTENNLYANLKGELSLNTTQVLYSKLPTRMEESNKITIEKIIANPKKYYGKAVNYKANEKDTNTYRIFYVDTTGEFGDEPNTLYLKADVNDITKELSVEYNQNETKVREMNPKWAKERGNEIWNDNEKASAWICDPSKWEEYCNKEKANYAIGGPSVEMYIKSYNQTHDKDTLGNNVLDCFYQEKNTPGYLYKVYGQIQNSGWWTNDDVLDYSNTYKSMYCGKEGQKTNVWWLGSPSSGNYTGICTVNGINARLNRNGYSDKWSFSILISVKNGVLLDIIE